jgi:hypothetical protein
MKLIYALIISILPGTNPIDAQQVQGANDPLLLADLICNNNATPGRPKEGSLSTPFTLDSTTKMDTASYESQQINVTLPILNTAITQDSLLQLSDPYQQPETIDPTTLDAFFLYPNPTTGIVQVKLSGQISVLIYTISGQLIKKYTLATGERVLDLSELPPGIYQVRARSEDDYFSGKLLIQ